MFKTKRSAQCSVCAAFPGKLLVCWEIVVLVIAAHQHRWGTVLGRPIRPIELLCFLIQAFCELPKKIILAEKRHYDLIKKKKINSIALQGAMFLR